MASRVLEHPDAWHTRPLKEGPRMQGHRSASQGAWGDVAPPAAVGAGDEPRLPGPDDRGHPRAASGCRGAAAGPAGWTDRHGNRRGHAPPAALAGVRRAAPAGASRGLLGSELAAGRSGVPEGGERCPLGTSGGLTAPLPSTPGARPGRGRPTVGVPTARGRSLVGRCWGRCWRCWACVGPGTKDAPSGRATPAAASAARPSEHPADTPAIPHPIPRRAPDGVSTARTARYRRSELPSAGVGRKNRGRLPRSRWLVPSRWVLLGRPAGEEKRPANPTRAAIYGLAVRVYEGASGIDPDRSAARPSAALHAPAGVVV